MPRITIAYNTIDKESKANCRLRSRTEGNVRMALRMVLIIWVLEDSCINNYNAALRLKVMDWSLVCVRMLLKRQSTFHIVTDNVL